jgi:RimJ/RimL family protein N-acetyltransferase
LIFELKTKSFIDFYFKKLQVILLTVLHFQNTTRKIIYSDWFVSFTQEMKLIQYKTFKEFQKNVYPFLLEYEAENSFLFDLIHKYEKFPKQFQEINFWSLTKDSQHFAGSILAKGEIKRFAISKTIDNVNTMPILAKNLLEIFKKEEIPAPTFASASDATLFSDLMIQFGKIKSYQIKMKMYLYSLTKDNFHGLNQSKITGELIKAELKHVPILLNFWRQFMIDVFGENSKNLGSDEVYLSTIELNIKNDSLFLWKLKNDEIVSMIVKSGWIPNGNRLGMVYTPLNLRGNGYGSAIVSHLCGDIFENGSSIICLYADAINPISNKIYQQIGFKEIDLNEIHQYSQ